MKLHSVILAMGACAIFACDSYACLKTCMWLICKFRESKKENYALDASFYVQFLLPRSFFSLLLVRERERERHLMIIEVLKNMGLLFYHTAQEGVGGFMYVR
ncbi:hypothetical protein F5X96DRAFT_626761 [Biscogniauxia mediterranea]|nr:hypothetical protein F5X96DRAFT_626761 [Biscogniauxia mediterranea]